MTKNRWMLFVAGLLFLYSSWPVLRHNTVSLIIQQQVIHRQTVLKGSFSPQPTICSEFWLAGLYYDYLDRNPERNDAWLKSVHCRSDYVDLIRAVVPDDIELVILLTQETPQAAQVWFWLGDLQPELAIAHYRRGLSLAPENQRIWLKLGYLLENTEHDPKLAMDAYLQACVHGEPGGHGCSNAAKLAKNAGNSQLAIQYLRLSRLKSNHIEANAIEAELRDNNTIP